MKKLIPVLLLIFSFLALAQENIYFVIRVDDIQSRNTVMLPRTLTGFQKAVENRGAKVSWAVIPHRIIESQNTDGEVVRDLKASVAKGHEIILHGYNHICIQCGQSSHEMVCTSQNYHFTKQQQLTFINDGLKILKDSLNYIPAAFVPPAHQADTTTYNALLEKGLGLISTTSETKKNIWKSLYNLAPNNEYTWSMTSANYQQSLVNAIKDVKATAAANGYYCLLLHDPFIREGYENGIVIKWTSELLDSLNAFYGNKIKYVTLSEAAKIFRTPAAGVAENGNINLTGYELMQNFPNPFNPSTSISYYMPVSGEVKITVYNSLGQVISQLAEGYMNAGVHTVNFNGKELTSGVYYCVMQSGSFIKTRKLILLK